MNHRVDHAFRLVQPDDEVGLLDVPHRLFRRVVSAEKAPAAGVLVPSE